jgi:hypothetical protein
MHIEFTTILHRIQKKFDLTLNEYAICNSINYLQNTQEHYTRASALYLGSFIGITERSAKRILKRLEEKELIRKMKRTLTNHYCTTDKWNDEFIQESYPQSRTKRDKKSYGTGQKVPFERDKKSYGTGQKVPFERDKKSPNIYSYKDNIKTSFLDKSVDKSESKLQRNKRHNGLTNIKNILNNPDFASLNTTENLVT